MKAGLSMAAGQQMAQTRVQLDLLYHQMKTTDQAGRLVLQRRKNVIDELQSILAEWRSLDAKSLELFNRYWQAADVAALKSNLELKAGLRSLQQADADNEGAQFALAITHMRLKEFDEALPLLNQLVQTPAVRGVALAARAELYVRMGKADLSSADMRQALSIAKKDPRVRLHCAMALAAAGSLRTAESEWEAVLKLGTQEIAARRAIALIHAAAPTPSDYDKKIANGYAQLAAKLAGEEDWACQMACALAAQASGQTLEAIRSAQRASDAAIGDKRVFCDAAIEQLKQGSRPSWQF
jgi:tetratricopeptide (TPR) repeat protein